MSGRKQHFIPQSLLKGFGRPGRGEKIQVVVFTLNRGIFSAATDGVAAEREFYSKLAVEGEGETLDDRITTYESRIAVTLARLRALKHGEVADAQAVADFVTHLVVRNDHLRKIMSSAGTALFDGFADAMSDEGRAKALLGLSGERPSKLFAEEMDKAFDKYGSLVAMLGMSREQFANWAFEHSKANFEGFYAEISEPLQRVFSESTSKVAPIAADAHRRSLEKTIKPKAWVEKLKSWAWKIVHIKDALVLPDCVAIATNRNGAAFSLMLADLNEAEAIYLPVSSHRLVVGSKSKVKTRSKINELFASCCWDFFVAEARTPTFETLRGKVRSRSGRQVSMTIDGAVKEALQKHSQ